MHFHSDDKIKKCKVCQNIIKQCNLIFKKLIKEGIFNFPPDMDKRLKNGETVVVWLVFGKKNNKNVPRGTIYN